MQNVEKITILYGKVRQHNLKNVIGENYFFCI